MKPRNPIVPAMMRRKAGAHGKTKKAQRRKDKVAFKNGKDVYLSVLFA